MRSLDLHHHFIPPELLNYIEKNPVKTQAQVWREGQQIRLSFRQGWNVPVAPGHFDNEVRQRDMAAMGIDGAALSVAPVCFFYWLDGKIALETSRICNDWVAEQACKRQNLYPMATLPMQDPVLALAELERAHGQLGIKALEIAPVIQGVHLDDHRFWPLYDYCATNAILLFLHPQVMERRAEYERYYNGNLIGNPLETCIGLNHLLFGGVFQEFPELRVLAAHGGGYFPYQFGRLKHGYAVRPEPRVHLKKGPEDSLKNIYFDTIVHWAPALQFLTDCFGSDHVVIGSDYPFDMGDFRPVETVNQLRLTVKSREAICVKNAKALLQDK